MEETRAKEIAALYADAIIAENFTKAADLLELISKTSYEYWSLSKFTGVNFYSINEKISELRKR